jgi:hypothetical protein
VRRALREIEELVEREYDRVSLKSSFIADLVHDAVKEAQGAFDRVLGAGAKALEASKRGLDETTSAFMAWAARHDVDVNDDRDARMRLRMEGTTAEVKRAVCQGYRLWVDAGKEPARYRDATIYHADDGAYSPAWTWLPD